MASQHHGQPYEPRESARRRSADSSPLRMARLIEGEIIPRLLLAHRVEREIRPQPAIEPTFIGGEPTALAHLTLRLEVFGLVAHVEAYLTRGITIESVYLELLAPAARVLGDFWDNDICDFVDVTMGLWRLQQVVHELGSRASCPNACARADRRALFTVPPGDQHSFGLVIVEDFFGRAGWQTWSAPDAAMPELCAIVGRQWFELIGVTVSNADHVERLPSMFLDLRRSSQNPAVGIMVGGKIFSDHPELAAQTGADATAADAPQALLAAERLVERFAYRPGAA